MSNTYYIADNGQPTGPFTLEQIRDFHTLAHNTLVWNETMTEWTPAGQIPELVEIINQQWSSHQPLGQTPPAYSTNQAYAQNNNAQQQYYPPYPGVRPIMPKTWLAESILVTLFCCLPFGIVGIVKASNVSSEYNRGNYEGAERASRSAKNWTLISFFIGIGQYLLSIIFFVLSAIMSGASSILDY